MSSDFKENHLVLDSYLIVGNQVLSEIVNFQGFKSLSLAWLSFREGKTKLFRELWIFVVELVPQHKPQFGRIRKKWVYQSISSFSIKTVALEYFTRIFFLCFLSSLLSVYYEIQRKYCKIPSVIGWFGGNQNIEDKPIYSSLHITAVCNIYKQM